MSSFELPKQLGLPELSEQLKKFGESLTKSATTDNPELAKQLASIFRRPGKRFRSSLVLAIIASYNKKINEQVMAAMAAVELMHLASLVHDDIIDNAKTRHGATTVSAKAGNDRAIILGDFLLAKSAEQAAIAGQAIAKTLASAFARVCEGQALELADLYNLNRTKASYLKATRGKTASLFSATCQIGGLCADLNQSQTDVLADFGDNFGTAFQLLDDVLDFISSPELLKKPTGADAPSGNYTLPLILALESQPKKYKQLAHRNPKELSASLIADGFITQAILEIQKYNLAASKALNGTKNLNKVADLPDCYTNWVLENLALVKVT